MGRKGFYACLFAGIWLAGACEAQAPGSMELVFQWPDAAPDFDARVFYVRGELQMWPDGVDALGNPVTVSQRVTGRSSEVADQAWIQLGGIDTLAFDGLSYGVDLGVVIEVHDPNSNGGADPPGELLYYGRSQAFKLEAGEHTVVTVSLAIQAAPGVQLDTGTSTTRDSALGQGGLVRVCHVPEGAPEPEPEACDDSAVPSPEVLLYFEAANSAVAVIANDAAFSVGVQELALADLTPVEGDLYRWPGTWDLNAGLPTAGDGLRSVYVKLRNALGLESKALSQTVVLDSTGPALSVSLSPEQTAWRPGSSLELLVSAGEALSGDPVVHLDDVVVSAEETESGAFRITLPDVETDGVVTLEVQVQDASGNAASWSRSLPLDATLPTVVDGSVVLSGGVDELCEFEATFLQGVDCEAGVLGFKPEDTLSVTFTVAETNPEMEPVTGAPSPPILRVGSFVGAPQTCALAADTEPLEFVCTFEFPQPSDADSANQVLEVVAELRDAAQNTATGALGTIRYVPQAPSAFPLGQPTPLYNAQDCAVRVDLGIEGGVPAAVELMTPSGSGLSCIPDDSELPTVTTHPFVCACSPEVARGGIPLSAAVTDFFARTSTLPLDVEVYVDPQAPTITGAAEVLTPEAAETPAYCLGECDAFLATCEAGCAGDASCQAACATTAQHCEAGILPTGMVLTEGDILTVRVPLETEVITADAPFADSAHDGVLDPSVTQVTLGGYPLEWVSQAPNPDDETQTHATWRVVLSEAIHAGAEGPTQLLQGTLRDAVGNAVSFADALPCPVPTVTLDFTPPEVLVPVPFAHVLDADETVLFQEIVTTSPDSVSLSVQAWSCVGAGPCFSADPDTWQVVTSSESAPIDLLSGPLLEPGQWSIPLGLVVRTMPDGRYAIAAMATDRVGLASEDCVGPLTGEGCWVGKLVVDSAPPVVVTSGLTMADDTPLAGKLRGGDTVRITAEVSDLLASRDDTLNPLVATVLVGNVPVPIKEAAALGCPACCATTWSGTEDNEVALDCWLEIDADSPSGPVSVVLEVSDGTHQGEAATTHVIGTLHIDNDAPTVTLDVYEPPAGVTATAGASLSVSLSFDEEVVLAHGSLWALNAADPFETITLTHSGELSAAVHTWSGTVFDGVVSGTYTIEPSAKDIAGNPYSGGLITAFEVDTDFLTLDDLELTVDAAEDGSLPIPGYAGVGDTIAVAVSVDDDSDWSPNTSQVDLDGLSLTWQDQTEAADGDGVESWQTTVDADVHVTFSGLRAVGGVLRDDAGNETPFETAVATWDGPWPSVTIDTRPPDLAIPTQINRCDGYGPAQEAENRLHVKASWSEGECPSSWGVGSCSDPAAPASGGVPAPIRLTFILDEPIQLSSAVVTVGDTGAVVIVDHCLSYDEGAVETSRVVAWFDPHTAELTESGDHEVTLLVSDLAGNAVGRTNGELLVDVQPPESPAVDVADIVTVHRYPWGTDVHAVNSSQVEGQPGAAESESRVLVYDAPDVKNAQLLNKGESDGALVDEDGGFEAELLAGDRATVFVQVRDRAGNVSDGDPGLEGSQATKVRDIAWTATMNNKVAGSDLVNPHTLLAVPWFKRSVAQGVSWELDAFKAGAGSDNQVRTASSARWLNRDTPPQPFRRTSAAMTYDVARGVSVVFGGFSDHSVGEYADEVADTWEWNGEVWTERQPIGDSPPWRSGHVFAHDLRRGVSLLFSGNGGAKHYLQDLWEWDGEAWTERIPEDGVVPPPREGAQLVYDSARGVTVLFGGFADTYGPDGVTLDEEGDKEIVGDLWEWDGERWTERHPEGPTPAARMFHAMTYDEKRGVIVLFGGSSCPHPCSYIQSEIPDEWEAFDDTWEWNGETWTERAVEGPKPPQTKSSSMAYHSALGQSFLFGETGDQVVGYERIAWLWDGSTWTEVPESEASEPGLRETNNLMVYDSRRSVVVVFGGGDNGPWWRCGIECANAVDNLICVLSCMSDQFVGAYDDTWEWDGTLWKERVTGPANASNRHGHAMVYDTARGVTTLFGGRSPDGTGSAGSTTFPNDVWEWDGERWLMQAVGGACETDYIWVDSIGDDCVGYESNPGWCDDAASYVDSDGVDANMACCVCVQVAGEVPAGRCLFGMAYDVARKETLVVSGSRDNRVSEQDSTWLWHPVEQLWTETLHSDVADCVSANYALPVHFGSADPYWKDTRGFDCTTYDAYSSLCSSASEYAEIQMDGTQLCCGCGGGYVAPGGRERFAMTYDRSRSVALLFGGWILGALTSQSDLWMWDGTAWTETHPVGETPASRQSSALSYDTHRNVSLLFGGLTITNLFGTNGDYFDLEPPHALMDHVWEWDGDAWASIAPDGGAWPSVRHEHAIVYDTNRRKFVLYGGRYYSKGYLQDTWEYDAETETWTEQNYHGEIPLARAGHAMVFDEARGVVVLYGGTGLNQEFDDTWELNQSVDAHPGHLWTVDWSRSLAGLDVELTQVSATWRGGGQGHEDTGEDCLPVPGAELMVWLNGAWRSVAQHDHGLEDVGALSWATEVSEDLESILLGRPGKETIQFALVPATANTCGDDYAEISTDLVAVTVNYRLSAE